jgi:hypothetical protein
VNNGKLIKHFVVTLTVGLMVSCSTNSGPSQTATQSLPASVSSPNPKVSIVSRNGCTFDLMKLCQAGIERPEIVVNSGTTNWTQLTQNAQPHIHLYFFLILPNHDDGGTVNCYIAVQQRQTISAELLPDKPMSDEALNYVKSLNGCEEQQPNYTNTANEFDKNQNSLP